MAATVGGSSRRPLELMERNTYMVGGRAATACIRSMQRSLLVRPSSQISAALRSTAQQSSPACSAGAAPPSLPQVNL